MRAPDYWVIKPYNRTAWALPRSQVHPLRVPRCAFYTTPSSGDGGGRTRDNRLAEPVLYQLSYIPNPLVIPSYVYTRRRTQLCTRCPETNPGNQVKP